MQSFHAHMQTPLDFIRRSPIRYDVVPLWLLQVGVPLKVHWGYTLQHRPKLVSHSTLRGTPTCRSHSGTALYETYVAVQRILGVCKMGVLCVTLCIALRLYSPEKWLHNRIYCPGNRSKQIQETHTVYSADTQYTRQSLNEKQHTWLHSR